eukprot:TRINITY_DN16736_c0_g1_i7.p1 TRINITY_DN16736_c0_g1~~TRINITY_DN16736_c0_g1_i7.p1  ORF type:complete len:312 (-),score=-17.62 TRINITY_DN16736_c0_g1_i7:160-1095(-)
MHFFKSPLLRTILQKDISKQFYILHGSGFQEVPNNKCSTVLLARKIKIRINENFSQRTFFLQSKIFFRIKINHKLHLLTTSKCTAQVGFYFPSTMKQVSPLSKNLAQELLQYILYIQKYQFQKKFAIANILIYPQTLYSKSIPIIITSFKILIQLPAYKFSTVVTLMFNYKLVTFINQFKQIQLTKFLMRTYIRKYQTKIKFKTLVRQNVLRIKKVLQHCLNCILSIIKPIDYLLPTYFNIQIEKQLKIHILSQRIFITTTKPWTPEQKFSHYQNFWKDPMEPQILNCLTRLLFLKHFFLSTHEYQIQIQN